jgi:hypothetical protein
VRYLGLAPPPLVWVDVDDDLTQVDDAAEEVAQPVKVLDDELELAEPCARRPMETVADKLDPTDDMGPHVRQEGGFDQVVLLEEARGMRAKGRVPTDRLIKELLQVLRRVLDAVLGQLVRLLACLGPEGRPDRGTERGRAGRGQPRDGCRRPKGGRPR